MKKISTTISIAIATFNEASNISSCLDSVANWVDEIIIVDGQSNDQTVKISQKYPKTKVISVPNQPMFHRNKQLAIDHCHSDWILQLDADEVVSLSLKKEIQNLLRQPVSAVVENGFWLNRSNYFLGRFLKKGGQYPDPTLRLYKRGSGKLPCLSVHEQAVVPPPVGRLTSDLLHFADADFDRYLLRNNRYTTLMSEELTQPSFFDYLITKPLSTFFRIYFRHRGFVDGFPGFVFAYFSALSYFVAYIKYYGSRQKNLHRS